MGINDPWVTTYSGRQFFITRATVDDIYIEDIAHGLSNVCRYAGQCKTFYSVAEHSVRMAKMAWSPSLALHALLHDAPEAYMCDVPSLIKRYLPKYREMEACLLGVIFDKYGVKRCPLMNYYDLTVKTFDELIRTPEVLSLFPAHNGWELDWEEGECEYDHIRPWSHRKAEKKFLKMFRKLYKEAENR